MEGINAKVASVSSIRRRVYCFGIICMIMALGQLILFMIMLGFSISENYHDAEVAAGSGIMAVGIATYLALTARMLFLLYERRYAEAKGPEWLWWYASLVVIIFNALLMVWFALLGDIIPAVVCGAATVLYGVFFKSASNDVKRISDNDNRGPKRRRRNDGDITEPNLTPVNGI